MMQPTPTPRSWRTSKRVWGGVCTILAGAGTICTLLAGSDVKLKAAGVALTTVSAAFTTWFGLKDAGTPIRPPTVVSNAGRAIAASRSFRDVKQMVASMREAFAKKP